MLGADPVRKSVARLIDPVAKGLLKIGITANWVTLVGTAAVCATALITFPQGEFLLGTIVICLFAVFDLLDGTMARLSGSTSKWGAYVDSVSDRLADGAMMGGVVLYFALSEQDISAFAALAALVFGQIVSYSRARAESLGMQARIGVGERAERTIIFLLGTLLAGLGLEVALPIAVWVLAVINAITIIQRAVTVYAQATLEKR
jgi:CDP-diacylglycerol--glycerol-3-phosphate 3-phosphatidyltransferase